MGSVEQPLEIAPRPIQHVYSKRQKKKPTDENDLEKKKKELLGGDSSLASQENGALVKPDASSGGGTIGKAAAKEKSCDETEATKDQEKLQGQHKSDGDSEDHRKSKMSRLLEVATSEFHSEELLIKEGGEVATTNGGLKGYQRRRKRQIVQAGDGAASPAESSPRKKLDSKTPREDPVTSDRVSNGADGDGAGERENEAEGGEEEEEEEYNGEEEEEEEDVEEEDDDEEEEKRAPRRRGRARKAPSPKMETIKVKRRPGRPRKVRPPPSPDNTTATAAAAASPATATTTRNQKNASGKEALQQSSEDHQDENLSDHQERLKRARGFKRVYRWLQDLELLKYAECFEKHEVEDDVLPLLTFDDLREMGVSAVGARRKMFTSIQDMELPRRKSRS